MTENLSTTIPQITISDLNTEVIFKDKINNVILVIKLLDDDGNIHLETKTEVYDGPADLLLKM